MKNEKAFTLIEILIAILITSITLALIGVSFTSGTHIKSINEDTSDILQNIRIATQLMSQELRMAGYELAPNWNPTALRTTNQITATNTSSITFYYVADNTLIDSDGDGILDTNQTVQITYSLSGSDLVRSSVSAVYDQATQTFTVGASPANNIIATNVDQLQFMYLWGDGVNPGTWNTTPAPQAVPGTTDPVINRAVEINLVVRSNLEDRQMAPYQTTYTEPQANTVIYTNPLDSFRRRFVSNVVNLRNMQ